MRFKKKKAQEVVKTSNLYDRIRNIFNCIHSFDRFNYKCKYLAYSTPNLSKVQIYFDDKDISIENHCIGIELIWHKDFTIFIEHDSKSIHISPMLGNTLTAIDVNTRLIDLENRLNKDYIEFTKTKDLHNKELAKLESFEAFTDVMEKSNVR